MTPVSLVILVQGLLLIGVGAYGQWGLGKVNGALACMFFGVLSIVVFAVLARLQARQHPSSLWRDAWRRLRKNRMALLCAAVFWGVVLFSFAGPTLARAIAGLDGIEVDVYLNAVPPSWSHWMGTDPLGRDMMVRIMEGGQWAIWAGLSATTVALIIGVTWGSVAGYLGGKTDEVMMRVVDVLYAFPTVVFVIVIMAVWDTKSMIVLFALIGSISWLNMSRIVRGQVLSLRNREFIEAAHCVGATTPRILLRHIVPNTLGPIIVYSTLSLPGVMLTEAFLSFLGLGVQAPRASWGTLVTEGASQIAVNPWTLIFPGLVMGITIFVLNFLGDGVRDALDPQMRKD